MIKIQQTEFNTILLHHSSPYKHKTLADLVVHNPSAKFLSVNNFIIDDLLCKAAKPPIFYPQNMHF